MIYFVHIHRTGGTTLKSILKNNYKYRSFFYSNPKRANEEFSVSEYDAILHISKFYKVIESHHIRYPSPNKKLNNIIKPITFLRNPVERFLSNYFYLQQIADENHYANQPIEDYINYIKKNLPSDVRYFNGQTLQIAREFNINKAKDILDQFYFVGITELYDESLLLLNKKFNENLDVRYEVKNKGKVKQQKKDQYMQIINSYIYDKLLELNDLDLELYSYARNNIKREIDLLGPEFKKKLQEFKTANLGYRFPFVRTKFSSFISKICIRVIKNYTELD